MRSTIVATILLVAAGAARAQPTASPGYVIQDSKMILSMGEKCAQHKLAFVEGRWWGIFSTAGGVDFYVLDRVAKKWSRPSFADAHISSDASSRADVIWTGQSLLVLTNEKVSSIDKLRLRVYRPANGGFVLEPGYPVDVVTGSSTDGITPLVQTVVVDSAGRAWVTYRKSTTGYVKGSTGTGTAGWTQFGAPIAIANLTAGLGDTIGYMAAVTFAGKTGVFWMDQRDGSENGFKFRWRNDADPLTATWQPEEIAQNGIYNLADDHVSLQSFEGKIYVVVKTNIDKAGTPHFELLRRETDGRWRVWPVYMNDGTWRDSASRPILLLEPGRRLVHVLYNGGGIVRKTTSMDSPDFLGTAAVPVVVPSTQGWNSQSTAQHVDATSGIVVVCDGPKNDTTWQFWGEVAVGSSPPPAPGPVASVTVTPGPATTTPGGAIAFSAQARDANGTAVASTFAWSATRGSIDSTGRYTAPVTSETFMVTAATGGVAGPAIVTVAASPPPPPPPPLPQATVIVDDGDPGWSSVSGRWVRHFNPYRYGLTNHLIDTGATGTCRFRPTLTTATYDVSVWVPSRGAPAMAVYRITTVTGPVTVNLDQQKQSTWGVWTKLGTFALDANTAKLELDAATGQSPAADAVRFVKVGD